MEFAFEVMAAVASRDASIARVLREICVLDSAARRCALDLVRAHLGPRASRDVLECLEALRGDDLARQLAERSHSWGGPGAS
jgi:hypothetical protein